MNHLLPAEKVHHQHSREKQLDLNKFDEERKKKNDINESVCQDNKIVKEKKNEIKNLKSHFEVCSNFC